MKCSEFGKFDRRCPWCWLSSIIIFGAVVLAGLLLGELICEIIVAIIMVFV